jgi:diaminohydroxyphosphoribosylaminopyrimidine deaminase / 5-amino-6-(5-phosphoribosylamino)uracil reductase
MPPPTPAAVPTVDGDSQRRAWRAVLAAAAWAKRGPEARGGPGERGPHGAVRGFGVDEAGALAPAAADGAAAWLLVRPDGGWSIGPGAPESARPLLDLYLPLCAANAGRPLAIGHLGQSLDGCIATRSGDSYYVTGPDNVLHLHRLRALCDAVIVGAGTVARDDPQLTVRHCEGANPVRVIIDPRRRLGLDHRVFAAGDARTLLVCADANVRAADSAHGAAEVVGVPGDETGKLRLDALLARLRERGLDSIFVEGGGATVSSFLEAELLDRLHVAIAPLVTGSGRRGLSLPARDTIAECLRPSYRVFAMGGDVLFDCDLRALPADDTSPVATGDLSRVI